MRSDDVRGARDMDDTDDVDGVDSASKAPEDERARRAVTLYLQGQRVAEVAATLEVSETTVRRWAHRALATLAAEERAERASQLQRAIEGQRAVASAAWDAYERERQLDEALLRGELDHVRRRAIRGRRASGADAPRRTDDADCPPLAMEEYERPKRTAQGARYLSVALAAQREVARLQGLYARLEEAERDVRITISRRPDGPENRAPAPESSESDPTPIQEPKEARRDERDA